MDRRKRRTRVRQGVAVVATIGACTAVLGAQASPALAQPAPKNISVPRSIDGRRATLVPRYSVGAGYQVTSARLVAKRGRHVVASGARIKVKPGRYRLTQTIAWRTATKYYGARGYAGDEWYWAQEADTCHVDSYSDATSDFGVTCNIRSLSHRTMTGRIQQSSWDTYTVGENLDYYRLNLIALDPQTVWVPQLSYGRAHKKSHTQSINVRIHNRACLIPRERDKIRLGTSKDQVRRIIGSNGYQESYYSGGYELRSYYWCDEYADFTGDLYYINFTQGRVTGWSD